MSQNLVPIRKLAYIFDRRHFGMIGTVTQRDTILEGGRERAFVEEGKLEGHR